MNNTRIGNKNYISPEIIYGDKYDFKIDIFSLGITIFYLMYFNLPYYSKIDEFQNVERYFNGNIINQCYSIHLRNLVMKMLNSNPNNRPNSFQAYDELIMIEQNSQNNKLNQNFINFQNFQNNQNINFQNNYSFQQFQNNRNFQNIFYNNFNNLNNQNNPNIILQNQNIQKNQLIKENLQNKVNEDIIKIQNYSLLRVIESLCNIKEFNLENIKTKLSSYCKDNNNILISLEIINLIELMRLKLSNNKIDNKTFINKIIEFRNKLSSKFEKLKDEEEIRPKFIFNKIFQVFNDEFKNNKITWNNKIFNKIIELEELPRQSFPEIYKKIKGFKNEYNNPVVDIFYYISLDTRRCPDCHNISQVDIKINYSLNISSTKQNNITEIIKDYMIKDNSEEKYKCSTCYYRGPGKKENSFYITPKYLLIDFEFKNKFSFEEFIDLSPYALTNIGPKKYSLYTLINKENNDKFISFIKTENNWNFYSDKNNVEKCSFDSINYGIPYIAIYKGLE